MRSKAWFTLIALAPLLCPGKSNAGDGLAGLQTAAPSCPDDSGNIYVDCGNGTVTDNRTGLVWLANANCWGSLNWHQAMEIVAGLADQPVGSGAAADDCGLSDASSPGEWRLPSLSEWEAMVVDAVDHGCVFGILGGPSITDDAGTSCWQETSENNFSGVVSSLYWSSLSRVTSPSSAAWGIDMLFGIGDTSNKAGSFHVWPVRGGQ